MGDTIPLNALRQDAVDGLCMSVLEEKPSGGVRG